MFLDTLEIEPGTPLRFSWALTFADDESSTPVRTEVVGELLETGVGFHLVADNHPVYPRTIYAGLLYEKARGYFELQAFPPWRSTGLTVFTYRRVD